MTADTYGERPTAVIDRRYKKNHRISADPK
jgi:hypothetical protein